MRPPDPTPRRLSAAARAASTAALDPTGVPDDPLTVVDLDDLSDLTPALVDDLQALHTTVLVGVAHRALDDDPLVHRLVDSLDVVLAPADPRDASAGVPDDLESIARTVAVAPVAALTLTRLLRTTEGLSVEDALSVESWAYSSLLGGEELRRWRDARAAGASTPAAPDLGDRVLVSRSDDVLDVELTRPGRRNAVDARMRDAMVEAFAVPLADPSIRAVHLRAAGPDFCSGGDLSEFGTTGDLAVAALVRREHSPALAAHQLGDRLTCHLHGACVGAGVEVPSLAAHVEAVDGTWFRLPELAMGLVPGAGGTVGIPRRIGRWRTAYLALTGCRLELDAALDWGLVDARA